MNLVAAGLGVFASNTLFNALLASDDRRWTRLDELRTQIAMPVKRLSTLLLKQRVS